MRTQLLKSVFLIALFLNITSVFAQDWKEYQEIYKDGGITVKLKFKENFASCFTGAAKKSKMTFLVEGSLKSSPQYVNFKLDFFDCDEKFQQKEYSLDIGPTGALGEVESSDYLFFAANVARRPYEIKASSTKGSAPAAATSYPSNPSTTYPSNPSTTYPSSSTTTSSSSSTYVYKKTKPKLSHLAFDIGLDINTLPIIARQTTPTDSIGTTTNLNPMGIGGRADFALHPIFHKNVFFGIMTGISLGSDLQKKSSHFYYRWNFGGEFGVGVRAFKVIAKYQNFIQHVKHTVVDGTTTISANENSRREYIGGGFRFQFASKTKSSKRATYLDITVDGSRDMPWDWSSPKWSTSGGPWQIGMGAYIWASKSLKFGFDASLVQINNGKMASLDKKRRYAQVSLVYNIERFF